MPKQKYRCENGGALCPFALNGQLVEIESGETPPCGIVNCSTESGWLKPSTTATNGSSSRFKLVPALILLIVLAAATAYYVIHSRAAEPDLEKASAMLDEFYPGLPAVKGDSR